MALRLRVTSSLASRGGTAKKETILLELWRKKNHFLYKPADGALSVAVGVGEGHHGEQSEHLKERKMETLNTYERARNFYWSNN